MRGMTRHSVTNVHVANLTGLSQNCRTVHMGFTKLFESITRSSIWDAPDHVRIVWISLLALADAKGEVRASVPGLSRVAHVERALCEEALLALSSPDPDSTSKEMGGRRIFEIEGGWALVNHGKYMRMQSVEERRERDAERKRVQRASARVPDVTNVAESLPPDQTRPDNTKPDPDLSSSPATPSVDSLPAVRVVFGEWQRTHGHPQAKLDAKRTALIRRALKLHTAEQLGQAIRGALKDDWIMGRDLKSTKKYDGIETLLRDTAQIERLIDLETGKAKLNAAPSKRRDRTVEEALEDCK